MCLLAGERYYRPRPTTAPGPSSQSGALDMPFSDMSGRLFFLGTFGWREVGVTPQFLVGGLGLSLTAV